MGFRLNSCLCCSLRTGTLVTLYLELVLSILSILSAVVELIVLNGHFFKNYLSVIIPALVFKLVPFVVGLYGAHQRKPSFLMVAILDVFVLSGFFFHTAIQMVTHYYIYDWITVIRSVTNMLTLWYFGRVWYSYFLDLKKEIKSTQAGNVPLNSI